MKKVLYFLSFLVVVWGASFYFYPRDKFHLIQAEDKQIFRSLNGLVKALNESKTPVEKDVDFYAGNFHDSGIPEVKNPQHTNVLWLGGKEAIIAEPLEGYDYIFTSTPDLQVFMEKYGIKSYFLPMFVYDDGQQLKRECLLWNAAHPCYWVVIGDMPNFKQYLEHHHVNYKSYAKADMDTVLQLHDDFHHITGIASNEDLYEFSSIDVTPLYFEAALQNIPIIVYKRAEIFNLASLFFNDTIQSFTLADSIPALFDNINDTSNAKSLVEKFYTQEMAKERVLSVFRKKDFIVPAIKDWITFWVMSKPLETYSGDFVLARDLSDALAPYFKHNFVTFFSSILKYFGEVNVYMRGVISFSQKDILKNRLSILYLVYPAVDKFYTDNFEISLDDYIASIKDEFSLFDGVIAASDTVAQALNNVGIKAYYLPQFTNTKKFYPDFREDLQSDVLFVGTYYFNRPSVPTLLNNGIKVDIYGPNWGNLAKAPFIDNRVLRRYYSSAKIVLNDTRPDMKQLNFISNRIFDATACGAFVISDYVPEVEKVYGDSVPMWRTEAELVSLVRYYLAPEHEAERKEKAERAKKITLDNFTKEIAAQKFMNIVKGIKNKQGI